MAALLSAHVFAYGGVAPTRDKDLILAAISHHSVRFNCAVAKLQAHQRKQFIRPSILSSAVFLSSYLISCYVICYLILCYVICYRKICKQSILLFDEAASLPRSKKNHVKTWLIWSKLRNTRKSEKNKLRHAETKQFACMHASQNLLSPTKHRNMDMHTYSLHRPHRRQTDRISKDRKRTRTRACIY